MSNLDPAPGSSGVHVARKTYLGGVVKRPKLVITFTILTVLAIALLHVGGVFVAAFCWFVYGCILLWMHIFRTGTKFVARTAADEIDRTRAKRQED
jgi:hypothetical protein